MQRKQRGAAADLCEEIILDIEFCIHSKFQWGEQIIWFSVARFLFGPSAHKERQGDLLLIMQAWPIS